MSQEMRRIKQQIKPHTKRTRANLLAQPVLATDTEVEAVR